MSDLKKYCLILVPRLRNSGGIANYYKVMLQYLPANFIYLERGKDKNKNKFLRLLSDYRIFLERQHERRIKLILINTSLGIGGFFRDALYLFLLSKEMKTVVFFRGWNPSFEKRIDRSFFLKKFLEYSFLKSDLIIVLSSSFKKKLKSWGYKSEILLESTIVEEELIEGWTLEKLKEVRSDLPSTQLLYLGNVSKEKGVREVLEAIEILISTQDNLNFHTTIAGAGEILSELKTISKRKNLPVSFPGYVTGKMKINTFVNSHLYVFASYHEGMPHSVLEAMAFGLPVLTTRVGGIPDFFQEGKMGFYLDSHNSEHIAQKIQTLIRQPQLLKDISEFNYNYAKEHFYSGKVAKRLETIINNTIEKS